MNPQLRKLAPFGLYLALAALIIAAGLYIVYRTFGLPVQISLAVAVVGLASWVMIDPTHIVQLFRGRQARYGSNAIIMSVAFIGIVVVVNLVGYKYGPRWDLTEGKRNTLAPESVAIAEKLPEKVTAQAFYTASNPSDNARSLLDNFKRSSKGKFDYEFIDPNSNPVAAQNAKVQRDGTIVLNLGDIQEQVTYVTEQEIDSALLRLTNPTQRTVYFLSGHGEFNPDTADETGYSSIKAQLEAKNYLVKNLDLLRSSQIPEDAQVIVLASPQKPLSENEVVLLADYLEAGGSLLVFYEPSIITQFGTLPDPLADYLTTNWGIAFNNDLVLFLDKEPSILAIAGAYDTSHPVTAKMNQLASVFPRARSISIVSIPENVLQTILVYTSEEFWGETDLLNIDSGVSFDRETDNVGPLSLVVAAENSSTGARVVAIGDGEFATNAFYDYYGNSDFFINSIDWAAEQENLISLTPKNNIQRIMIPPQTAMMGLILLVTIFVIPGLVIVSGVVSWIQRRRRG